MLEPSDKPGRELSIVRRWRVLDTVRTHGTLHTQATVEAIEAREVLWHDVQGQAQRTPADSVVLAIGAEPDHHLAQSLSGLGVPVTAVGDGAEIGYIEGAMHGGNKAGREV